jgi:hypothetical protein
MTKDEALRLALNTLKEVQEETFRLMRNGEKLYVEDKVYETIYEIKKAMYTKDEPVGWIDSKGNMICTKINESCKPLYTSPQQRTWVGLTDEEQHEIVLFAESGDWHDFEVINATEAKLKEKNG